MIIVGERSRKQFSDDVTVKLLVFSFYRTVLFRQLEHIILHRINKEKNTLKLGFQLIRLFFSLVRSRRDWEIKCFLLETHKPWKGYANEGFAIEFFFVLEKFWQIFLKSFYHQLYNNLFFYSLSICTWKYVDFFLFRRQKGKEIHL